MNFACALALVVGLTGTTEAKDYEGAQLWGMRKFIWQERWLVNKYRSGEIDGDATVGSCQYSGSYTAPPMSCHVPLTTYGMVHTKYMAQIENMNHDNWSTRKQSVIASTPGINKVGENVASGFTNIADLVRAWTNSPSHRVAMCHGDYSHKGFTFYNVKEYNSLVPSRWYFTQLLAGRDIQSQNVVQCYGANGGVTNAYLGALPSFPSNVPPGLYNGRRLLADEFSAAVNSLRDPTIVAGVNDEEARVYMLHAASGGSLPAQLDDATITAYQNAASPATFASTLIGFSQKSVSDFIEDTYMNLKGTAIASTLLVQWTTELETLYEGTPSLGEVLVGMSMDPDFVTDWTVRIQQKVAGAALTNDERRVHRLFKVVFDRAADPSTLQECVRDLRNGETLAEIAEEFTTSSAFFELYGKTTTEEFLELLHKNGRGENPTTSWLQAQTAKLGSKPRGEIAVALAETTPEVETFLAPSLDILKRSLAKEEMSIEEEIFAMRARSAPAEDAELIDPVGDLLEPEDLDGAAHISVSMAFATAVASLYMA